MLLVTVDGELCLGWLEEMRAQAPWEAMGSYGMDLGMSGQCPGGQRKCLVAVFG
jgi:hypothetical protein